MKNISDSSRISMKIELKSKAKVAEVPAGKWRYNTLTLLNPIVGLPSIIWTSLCGDSAVATITITANKFKGLLYRIVTLNFVYHLSQRCRVLLSFMRK
jgi:hypothetical protein